MTWSSSCSLIPPAPALAPPRTTLPCTTFLLPARSTIMPLEVRTVLYRITLLDDFVEMTSASPSQLVNRLCSTMLRVSW